MRFPGRSTISRNSGCSRPKRCWRAQQKLAELEAGTRAEQKAAQQAAVAQLDAAIAGTDADLEQSRLTAPFAGTVVARHVNEGTVVSPGQIVLRLLEDSQLEAWFGLPVAAAERLKVGDRLAVLVEQREYPALVKAVLPELDMTTRTRRSRTGTGERRAPACLSGSDCPLDDRHGSLDRRILASHRSPLARPPRPVELFCRQRRAGHRNHSH